MAQPALTSAPARCPLDPSVIDQIPMTSPAVLSRFVRSSALNFQSSHCLPIDPKSLRPDRPIALLTVALPARAVPRQWLCSFAYPHDRVRSQAMHRSF